MPQKLALALALGLFFALGLPAPAGVSAAPSIFGCSQKDYGVIGFHANDPGWIDENGEHGDGFWFRWRIHGPGVDQVLYEGFMPRNEFETDGRIWGLKDGKTYYIEYSEIVPGYADFKLDILSCTAQGTSSLPFGFDVSIDGRATTYPKAPAATPKPTPDATATPKPAPVSTADPAGGAGDNSGSSGETAVASDEPSAAAAPSEDVVDTGADIALGSTNTAPLDGASAPLVSAAPGPYLVLLGLIGAVIGLLIVLTGRRTKEADRG